MAKNIIKTILFALLVLLLATGASLFWLNSGPLTQAKEKFMGTLPVPAAWVGGRPVTLHEYLNRRKQAENYASALGQELSLGDKAAIFNRMLQEKVINEMARQRNIVPTKEQIEEEYASRKSQYGSAGQNGLADELSKYGLNEHDYKAEAVKTDVAAANLMAWFYGQRDLNAQSYEKADAIISQITSGSDFAGLAALHSEDAQGKSVGGDTGNMPVNSMLPEVSKSLMDMEIGGTKLVPTRFGLEIIRLEDRQQAEGGQPSVRLRQIYLQGSDFDAWYSNEAKKIKIIKIVNL